MNAVQNKRASVVDTDRQRASAMRLLEDEMTIILSAETRSVAREFRELERSWDRRGREFSGRYCTSA